MYTMLAIVIVTTITIITTIIIIINIMEGHPDPRSLCEPEARQTKERDTRRYMSNELWKRIGVHSLYTHIYTHIFIYTHV